MELTITSAEREYLEATLEGAFRSLREEVCHAEEHRFKDDLKAE
jgi:hypothetical protein